MSKAYAGSAKRTAAWVLASVAACYGIGITARPLLAPDEYRYAEVAREMLASGDWIVPRLDGLLYFEKPPLGYWVTALAIGAFGENAVAVRLPFALATLLTAAIAYALVRRFGSGDAAARLAAIGFATCIGAAVIGTTAVLDALFSLGVSASLAALFVGAEHPPGRARQAWLAASGAACGAAFLTKGFLALAIPISVAVPYFLWSRRTRDLLRLAWTPLAVALAVAAPWSLRIAREQPDFWHHFVVNEHLRRFAGADPQHDAPFWYFAPVVAIGALPWSLLLVSALRRRPSCAASPLLRFCACWLLAPLVMLSLSAGKLMTYALPCFPPLFVWIAECALAQPRERLARELARIAWAIAALAAAAALALALWTPALLPPWFPALEVWRRESGALAALLAAALAVGALRSARFERRAAAIAAASACLLGAAALGFPTGATWKTPERWLAERVDPIPAEAIVVADRNLVQATCWHLRRADVYVVDSPGELRYGLAADLQARWLDLDALEALIRDPKRTRSIVVIGRSHEPFLPAGLTPARTATRQGAFFALYDGGAGVGRSPES